MGALHPVSISLAFLMFGVSSVSSCEIVPCPFSDQCGVLLSVSVPDVVPPGPGLWKLNTSILQDEEHVKLITDSWLTSIPRFPSLAKWWEEGKSLIKGLTIRFCSDRSADRSRRRNLLVRLVDHLKAKVDSGSVLPCPLSWKPYSHWPTLILKLPRVHRSAPGLGGWRRVKPLLHIFSASKRNVQLIVGSLRSERVMDLLYPLLMTCVTPLLCFIPPFLLPVLLTLLSRPLFSATCHPLFRRRKRLLVKATLLSMNASQPFMGWQDARPRALTGSPWNSMSSFGMLLVVILCRSLPPVLTLALSLSQRRGVISLSFKKGDHLDRRNWLLNVDYKLAARVIAG